MDVTYHRLKQLVFWPKMKEDTILYVIYCPNCQMVKSEHTHTPDLLRPLPIPDTTWTSIEIDFVTELPKSEGKEVIMVVVRQINQVPHFILLAHPYTILDVAHAFLNNIYKHYGLPISIISVWDPVFTRNFWRELIKLLGIK
jgi:Integrase zinc binding domain